MKWTFEKPTKPGWYWLKTATPFWDERNLFDEETYNKPVIVCVYRGTDELIDFMDIVKNDPVYLYARFSTSPNFEFKFHGEYDKEFVTVLFHNCLMVGFDGCTYEINGSQLDSALWCGPINEPLEVTNA